MRAASAFRDLTSHSVLAYFDVTESPMELHVDIAEQSSEHVVCSCAWLRGPTTNSSSGLLQTKVHIWFLAGMQYSRGPWPTEGNQNDGGVI